MNFVERSMLKGKLRDHIVLKYSFLMCIDIRKCQGAYRTTPDLPPAATLIMSTRAHKDFHQIGNPRRARR